MKPNYTKTLLAGSICLLGINLFGETQNAASEKSNGIYAFAEYYGYEGADTLGAFTREMDGFTNYVHDIEAGGSVIKPSGELTGGTLGYFTTLRNGSKIRAELSYTSGSPDATTLYYGTSSEWTENYKYKYDIDQICFSMEYTPASIDFLSFGLDYIHTSNDVSFEDMYIDYEYDYQVVEGWAYDKYKFNTSSDDILLTVAVKSPDFYLLNGNAGALYVSTKAKLGLGYSLRSCDTEMSEDYYDSDGDTYNGSIKFSEIDEDMEGGDYETHLVDNLPDDALIYDLKASVEITYEIGHHAITSITGYRYKADFDECDNSSYGLYTKLGYTYSW